MMTFTEVGAAGRLVLAVAGALGIALSPTDTVAGQFEYAWTLQPDTGVVYGLPGQTVGWGYVLTNMDDAGHWLVATGLESDPFQYGVADASIFDFPALAPGERWAVDFNDSVDAGLFRFTWDASAPFGADNSGDFRLSAQWWSDAPWSGGSLLGNADDAYGPYQAVAASPAPVPATFYLLVIGALTHRAIRRRTTLRQRSM